MENDNFESQLRSSVVKAELTKIKSSDKERVWNAIQGKRNINRKRYYAVAAILFMLGMVSVLYVKEDKTTLVLTKLIRKPKVTDLAKPQTLAKEKEINYIKNQVKVALTPQISENNETQKQSAIDNPISQTPLPKVDETVTGLALSIRDEKKADLSTNLTEAPEFTVQFKRGTSIVQNNNENLIIANLKKFKLKRDTNYFANAEEKQSTKLKLSFKKEN